MRGVWQWEVSVEGGQAGRSESLYHLTDVTSYDPVPWVAGRATGSHRLAAVRKQQRAAEAPGCIPQDRTVLVPESCPCKSFILSTQRSKSFHDEETHPCITKVSVCVKVCFSLKTNLFPQWLSAPTSSLLFLTPGNGTLHFPALLSHIKALSSRNI